MGRLTPESGHKSAAGIVIAIAVAAAFVWGVELGLQVVPGWVVIAVPGLRGPRSEAG